MYYCFGLSDIGTIRENNEDSFLINHIVMSMAQTESELSPPFLIGVADGVAGENSGEIASNKALEGISRIKLNNETDLLKEIYNIHQDIKNHGLNNPESINMQTTLCALAVFDDHSAKIINIGDSRLYIFRDNEITQLTKDQSLVEMLYENGQITEEEKIDHAQKNIILPVLGNVDTLPSPDIVDLDENFIKNSIIMLCSDGLSDYVKPDEIKKILSMQLSINKKVNLLRNLAIENGSCDNITIVALSDKE